jgi:alpha-ribazole phosphatase
MELVLVRHAESDARGRCYGRLDVELSDAGRAQCRRLAARLSREPVDAVVSSPLLRALATAEAIAATHGLVVMVLEELRELDFGVVEGRTYEEIAASEPELFERWMRAPTTVRFPDGESYEQLRERVSRAIAGLRARYNGQHVVAVTHGGVVRAALADALGVPAECIFRLVVDPASVTRLAWHDGVVSVRGVNMTDT